MTIEKMLDVLITIKNVIIFVFVIVFVVFFIYLFFIYDSENSVKDTVQYKNAEEEVLSSFKDYNIEVSIVDSFKYKSINVNNKSNVDLNNIYLIINPSMDWLGSPSGFELIKDYIKYEILGLSINGFRSPYNTNNYYDSIPMGNNIIISIDEFINTETGEKFSIDRFRLNYIYIRYTIKHNGFDVEIKRIMNDPNKDNYFSIYKNKKALKELGIE